MSAQLAQNQAVPKLVQRTINELFPTLTSDTPLLCYDTPWTHPWVSPRLDPSYVWDKDVLIALIQFWVSGDRAIKLSGPHGTGKTSAIDQFLAALNWPTVRVNFTPRTEAGSLKVQPVFTKDGPVMMLAPAMYAAKMGLALIAEEWNVIDPGEATGLNTLIEGRPETIPETGETIFPHEYFRVFATQNQRTAGYQGRNAQDCANDDRFVDLRMQYLDAQIETGIVAKVFEAEGQDPAHAAQLAGKMVAVAGRIRSRFMAESDADDALEVTMSTRTITRWARWTILSAGEAARGRSPVHRALHRVLTDRSDVTPATREAIHKIVEVELGEPDTASS